MGVAWTVLAPQRNDSAPDLHIRTSVEVNISRRSGWRRSVALTAGPCISLPEDRKPTTAWLVGLGRSPVSTATTDCYMGSGVSAGGLAD